MGFPATTVFAGFDGHAIVVGVFTDALASLTVMTGMNPAALAARADYEAISFVVPGSMTPVAVAVRQDDCQLPATRVLGSFNPVLQLLELPLMASVVTGLTVDSLPVAEIGENAEYPQECTFGAAISANLLQSGRPLNLSDVARAVYALWGYDGIRDLQAITIGRERIVQWCNAAIQLIYSKADRLEYFNREVLSVSVTTSGSVALPASVQQLHGVARCNNKDLRALETRQQVQSFVELYGASSVPLAFYVESRREEAPDSLAMTLHVAPPPASGSVTVDLDVTHEPPRWSDIDLLNGTIIPMPHKWVETLFLPLVRKWAAADGRMPGALRQEQIAEIDQQFAVAKEMLGVADSAPATTKKEVSKP